MRNYQKEFEMKKEQMRLEEERKLELKKRKEQIRLAEENLKKVIDDYYDFIKKGNYITDLTEYAGKELSEIKVVMENGDIIELNCFEILEVTDDGHLNISDYNWGLLKYEPEENIYVRWRYHFKNVWNIKGFFDISVRNEDED